METLHAEIACKNVRNCNHKCVITEVHNRDKIKITIY